MSDGYQQMSIKLFSRRWKADGGITLVHPRVPVELCRCGGSPQQSPRRLWTWDVSFVEAQGSVLCPLVIEFYALSCAPSAEMACSFAQK